MMTRYSAFISLSIVMASFNVHANNITATTNGNTSFDVTLSGVDNDVIITQSSNGDFIASSISGNNNTVNYEQTDTTALGGSNHIDFDISGDLNQTNFEQNGTLNKIDGTDVSTDSEITGNNNVWNVSQNGTGNEILLDPRKYVPTTFNTLSHNDVIDISQNGDRNKVNLRNENVGTTNASSRQFNILQDGDDNQISVRTFHGSTALLDLTQIGNLNTIHATTDGTGSSSTNPSVQTTTILQNGDRNYAVSHVLRNGSVSYIHQDGFYNHAFANATGGEQASITQIGDQNRAVSYYGGNSTITQTGNFNNYSHSNSLNSQTHNVGGNYNITQTGNNNNSVISGSGLNNTFDVTQTGNGNAYTLNHAGDNGVYTINQTSY